MKNFIFLNALALVLFSVIGCGNSNAEFEKEDLLLKEVYDIHDEVMPRMSEIVGLKGSLLELQVDTSREVEIKATISMLEKAEDGMMQWMNKIKQPEKLRETTKHEEIMSYLENQKQEISKVRDMMNNSIETAKRVLGTPAK